MPEQAPSTWVDEMNQSTREWARHYEAYRAGEILDGRYPNVGGLSRAELERQAAAGVPTRLRTALLAWADGRTATDPAAAELLRLAEELREPGQ